MAKATNLTDTARPGRPTIRPGVMYDDVAAAYDFLVDVFGFEGGLKIGMEGADGPIHCDVWVGDQCIMLFATADWNPTAMPPRMPMARSPR